MSDPSEEQATEMEVLESIFEGDEDFKKMTDNRVQYLFGRDKEKSFIVEFQWAADYPTVPCDINMDIFHNQNMTDEVRREIKDKMFEVAKENEGMAATFTLIEFAKENFDSLVENYTLEKIADLSLQDKTSAGITQREQPLTKSAKRRMWDRNEGTGVERGHNWVDILKHLSETKDR